MNGPIPLDAAQEKAAKSAAPRRGEEVNIADNDYDDFDFDEEEDCTLCGGDGYVHDCGEDTCCCANPDEDDLEPCGRCGGTGRH